MAGSGCWHAGSGLSLLPSRLILVGTSLAWSDGRFSLIPALAAAAGALLLQILSNFANDYFDFVKGVDTRERVGPHPRDGRLAFLTARELSLGMAAAIVTCGIGRRLPDCCWRLADPGCRGGVDSSPPCSTREARFPSATMGWEICSFLSFSALSLWAGLTMCRPEALPCSHPGCCCTGRLSDHCNPRR